jgi:hypothetical protein
MEVSSQLHTLSSITPRVKSPCYPTNKRYGGLKNQSGCGGKEKEIPLLLLQKLNPGHLACNLVIIQAELPYK